MLVLMALAIFSFESCKKDDPPKPPSSVTGNFESGSIGEFVKISETQWELFLANDNDNPDLPDKWRNWFYVKMENMEVDSPTEIVLKNRGWPYYYLPVYSYNQTDWYRFTEDEVSQNEDGELIMRKQFENREVWIARFYPYTLTHLENYIETIDHEPYVDVSVAGQSQQGKPVYVIKITDFDSAPKHKVIMHARTHPGETPPSFMLEGFIDFLLSGSEGAEEILSDFEFYIFPMQNVDGVIAGNYRTTPQTENLEVMWYYDTLNTENLTADAPQEVKIIHQYAKSLMEGDGEPVTMALNLHASNSEPDVRPFFFPHFGPEDLGYLPVEASLWGKQISLINNLTTYYGVDMIEPVPEQGGSSFASKTYPESWWWVNYQDEVMAITMEMTYGRAGYSPQWIVPDDLRKLGKDLALGIRDYYLYDRTFKFVDWAAQGKKPMNLKYPELYPPKAKDELKE